jgi:energy-coupling factor transporter ATP-binding protein EcfA2
MTSPSFILCQRFPRGRSLVEPDHRLLLRDSDRIPKPYGETVSQPKLSSTTPLRELEIIGVRVLGPAPVNDVYFEFSEGFRALYGLNGAGKSRLLKAVSDLLAGRRHGDGYVIVRLNAPEADLAHSVSLGSEVLASARRRFEQGETKLILRRIISEMLGDPDCEDDSIFEIANFAAQQGIWMIQPAGDESGWYAVPGFLTDEANQPFLNTDERALLQGSSPRTLTPGQFPLSHPLFSSGPLASAAASGSEDTALRELSAVGHAAHRPYPLVAFDHPRSHLVSAFLEVAHVLTNSDLTPEKVEEKTIEVIKARLEEFEEIPLEQALDGIKAGDRSLDSKESTPVSSWRRATEVANQLSLRATELLKDALPGDLTAKCTVGDPESAALIQWKVTEGERIELRLSDLSDAQLRWACLAIAYATNYYRRWTLAEDDAYEEKYETWSEDGGEAFKEYVDDTRRAIEDLRRQESRRDAGSDWEEQDEYEALPDELEDLENQLEFLDETDETYPSPTEAEIEALLQFHFKEMPISIFLDEPEAGLHRSAERGVVRLLRSIAEQRGFPVTVATHSPAFLEPEGAEPILLKKSKSGETELDMGRGVLERTADSLGISRLDRLGLYRTILLVEGSHDEIVLREFFKDELAELRVLVLPIRGARLMAKAADSLLLADFSEHRIFAMVDNSDQVMFEDLLKLAKSTTPGDEEAYLAGSKEILRTDPRDEHGFISSLIGRAHKQGLLERFEPIALSKGDILEYLPVEHFVAGAESWGSLHDLYANQSKIRPFKEWARVKKYGDFSDAAVEHACRSMDSVPRDLISVVNRLPSSPTVP